VPGPVGVATRRENVVHAARLVGIRTVVTLVELLYRASPIAGRRNGP